MAERGIDREHYAWYRDRCRYGTAPHAGFGLAAAFAGGTLPYVTGLAKCVRRHPLPENAVQRAVLMRLS